MSGAMLELDVFIWIGSFATAILVPHFGFGWSWWLAIAAGIPAGFVLYLPIWFTVIGLLRLFGVVGPQHSTDVRTPPNLGKKPERRG